MGKKIIQFPDQKQLKLEKLEKLIETQIYHSDPVVNERLQVSIKKLWKKYGPMPKIEVRLDFPDWLTQEQEEELRKIMKEAFADFYMAMKGKFQDLFAEIVSLVTRVCELENAQD